MALTETEQDPETLARQKEDAAINDSLTQTMEAIKQFNLTGKVAGEEEPPKPVETAEAEEEEQLDEETEGEHLEDEDEEYDEDEESALKLHKKEKKPSREQKPERYDKNKMRSLHNAKHAERARALAAEERCRELEAMLTESLSAGTYHYGKSAYAELDRAREAKLKGYENGDAQAIAKADEEIMGALLTIKELEKWANSSGNKNIPYSTQQQAYNQQPVNNQQFDANQQRYNADQQYIQEVVKDWVDNHPYINPESKKYNPNMAIKVDRFVKKLDRDKLYEPYTPEYFDEIDDYIESIKAKKTVNTAKAAPVVGGVRNSYSGNSSKNNSSNKIELTPEEKHHIQSVAHLGMTEEKYLEAKRLM